MHHALRHWLLVITLVCYCFFFGLAQDKPRQERPGSASPTDETALRALAEEFYAAYAKRDLDGLFRLWSAKSPDLAPRRQVVEQLFTKHEKIEVKNLTVRKVTGDGENAKLRVDVDINAVEATTGKLAAGLGRMMRAMECKREEAGWRVWGETAAVDELAASLAAAKTEQDRAALLAEGQELITVELWRH